MRLPRCSLYFALALSCLACSGSSAEAARVWPLKCYLQTQELSFGQTIAGTFYTCLSPFCICKVRYCPALCQRNPYGCTFVGFCLLQGHRR
jgi:hypothetical protein